MTYLPVSARCGVSFDPCAVNTYFILTPSAREVAVSSRNNTRCRNQTFEIDFNFQMDFGVKIITSCSQLFDFLNNSTYLRKKT